MKKLILLGFFASISFIGCNDESSYDARNCLYYGGYGCQTMYNGQSFWGAYGYPMSGMYYQGYQAGYGMNALSCGPNTQPIANGTYGIGCVPNGAVSGGAYYSTIAIPGMGQQVPYACVSNSQCVSGRCSIRAGFTIGACLR